MHRMETQTSHTTAVAPGRPTIVVERRWALSGIVAVAAVIAGLIVALVLGSARADGPPGGPIGAGPPPMTEQAGSTMAPQGGALPPALPPQTGGEDPVLPGAEQAPGLSPQAGADGSGSPPEGASAPAPPGAGGDAAAGR